MAFTLLVSMASHLEPIFIPLHAMPHTNLKFSHLGHRRVFSQKLKLFATVVWPFGYFLYNTNTKDLHFTYMV